MQNSIVSLLLVLHFACNSTFRFQCFSNFTIPNYLRPCFQTYCSGLNIALHTVPIAPRPRHLAHCSMFVTHFHCSIALYPLSYVQSQLFMPNIPHVHGPVSTSPNVLIAPCACGSMTRCFIRQLPNAPSFSCAKFPKCQLPNVSIVPCAHCPMFPLPHVLISQSAH